MEIYLVTSNPGKAREYGRLLKRIKVKQLSLKIPEPTKGTVKEISLVKARKAGKTTDKPILVEDSAFFIYGLNKLPGIKTDRLTKKFFKGSYAGWIKKLDKKNSKNRKAEALTVITYSYKGKTKTFSGITKGRVTTQEEYEKNYRLQQKLQKKLNRKVGFGFDVIFIPSGFKETMAVLDLKRKKDKISMRAKACRKLIEYLKAKSI